MSGAPDAPVVETQQEYGNVCVRVRAQVCVCVFACVCICARESACWCARAYVYVLQICMGEREFVCVMCRFVCTGASCTCGELFLWRVLCSTRTYTHKNASPVRMIERTHMQIYLQGFAMHARHVREREREGREANVRASGQLSVCGGPRITENWLCRGVSTSRCHLQSWGVSSPFKI